MERSVAEGRPTRRWAEQKAKQILARALSEDSDIIPCPQCGWVQAHMVRSRRHNIRPRLPVWLIVLGLIWFVFCILFVAEEHPAVQTLGVTFGIADRKSTRLNSS